MKQRWRSWMLAGALVAAPAAQGMEIADLLGAPQPEVPVAAAKAPVIAWAANERGVRNLWVASAPEFAPRKLTGYDEDDGQLLSSLALSADGRYLAYVRGGGPDAAGNASNPTGDPDGAEQGVWFVPSDGSAAPLRVAARETIVSRYDAKTSAALSLATRDPSYRETVRQLDGSEPADAGEDAPRPDATSF